MRRTDREVSRREICLEILDAANELFLAMHNGEYPYCLPLNFCRKDNCLYMHCAPEGRKLDLIAENPHVAFSAAVDIKIDAAKSTTYYRSVCGTGNAFIVTDESEKALALDLLALRYDALCKRPAPLANVRRVTIVKVEIASLTGKISLPAA